MDWINTGILLLWVCGVGAWEFGAGWRKGRKAIMNAMLTENRLNPHFYLLDLTHLDHGKDLLRAPYRKIMLPPDLTPAELEGIARELTQIDIARRAGTDQRLH